jgi:hypothetical protein
VWLPTELQKALVQLQLYLRYYHAVHLPHFSRSVVRAAAAYTEPIATPNAKPNATPNANSNGESDAAAVSSTDARALGERQRGSGAGLPHWFRLF